jgi:Rho GDP-dissociation inhibitor
MFAETLEPDVRITSLSILSPGRRDIVLPLPVDATKGVWFTLKEGSPYRLKFTFSVSSNIVSGLRYTNTVWKTGLKGETETPAGRRKAESHRLLFVRTRTTTSPT